ncbi:hypothetical protein JYG30_09385 [Fibrella sp. USSR17]
MNEQQGKHLDERVRQALDTTPDVPVPGSTFDAGKLWEQLRPELAAETVALAPKRTGQAQRVPIRRSWLVAASLAGIGLVMSWLLRSTPSLKETQGNRQADKQMAGSGLTQFHKRTQPKQAPVVDLSMNNRSQVAEKQRSKTQNSIGRSVHTTDVTDNQSTLSTTTVLADLPVAEILSTELTLVQAPPAAIAQKTVPTYPKRRFAIVHQNELRAEAETRSKLERNDRFVRLGSAPVSEAPLPIASTEEKNRLIIPLN